MELRTLQYFLTVAQEESFSKAAKVMHVTQPTLSRQIALLEKSLRVTLFQRSTRNIMLTDEGMLLRRRAEELLSLAKKTEQELTQQDGEIEGTITIGAGEMDEFGIVADCIKSFSEQHPKVHYNIVSGSADYIREYLERGLIDIAMLMEPVDGGKFETVSLPSTEKYVVLMRSDDPLASLEEIQQKDWVT